MLVLKGLAMLHNDAPPLGLLSSLLWGGRNNVVVMSPPACGALC